MEQKTHYWIIAAVAAVALVAIFLTFSNRPAQDQNIFGSAICDGPGCNSASCALLSEQCDGKDNNCNNQVDEGCKKCTPQKVCIKGNWGLLKEDCSWEVGEPC